MNGQYWEFARRNGLMPRKWKGGVGELHFGGDRRATSEYFDAHLRSKCFGEVRKWMTTSPHWQRAITVEIIRGMDDTFVEKFPGELRQNLLLAEIWERKTTPLSNDVLFIVGLRPPQAD